MTPAMGSNPEPIEKLMSLSRAEFERSMLVLNGSLFPASEYKLVCGGGHVTIAYHELPGVRLGTLLALPRARLTIAFDGADLSARETFLRRFDLAFQRGGG